ncbi:MAG TPA: hypothetical protein DEB73_03215 [Candidatus Magasanikbacteria bacterium]|uniref:Uncharacterized protein n=1 Tax=Candidatus Magasanikbacteria bacterium GW2011_GWA2_42_32 TaxID=1619039 RepID=A0A0G1CWI0_9BACT|nr:MAG: hypothetical protein UV20_C0043G0005 [Candidatus Magasanikbacteria bacterium GW2011_GWA2_42_32]HBV58240.1 hypothetical protein [Candidatus Magasanikbacteria bacterium]
MNGDGRPPKKKWPKYTGQPSSSPQHYQGPPIPRPSYGYGAPPGMHLDVKQVQQLVMTPRLRTRDLSTEELAATRCIHGE